MELNTTVAGQGPQDLTEGKEYEIASVEQVKTQLRGLDGLRVTCVDQDGEQATTMLWLRDTVSANSKLGAFITALGNNTDDWEGKIIYTRFWRDRNREIEVVGEEKPQAKTSKRRRS